MFFFYTLSPVREPILCCYSTGRQQLKILNRFKKEADPFKLQSRLEIWLRRLGVISAAFILLLLFITLYLWLSLPDVSFLKNENPKITALMQQRIDEAAEKKQKFRIRQRWVTYDNIPKQLKNAIRISEDAGFFWHEGVDYDELLESFKVNISEGSFKRGGSTITQQLAKNLFLSTEKSFFRKIKEYFIAKRLEEKLSKARIFHLYLNLIEFGPGIFGVEQAARTYFHRSVNNLNLEQMIRLAAVVSRPLIERPTRNSRWLLWRCRWIATKLKAFGFIDAETFNKVIEKFRR